MKKTTKKLIKILTLILLGTLFGFVGGYLFCRIFIMPEIFYADTKTSITPTPTLSVIELVNQVRTQNKLNPLTENQLLNTSAKAKACDMRDRNYFKHVPPGENDFTKEIDKMGYEYTYAGENLTELTTSPIEDMLRLMASSLHREAILSLDYTEIGVGYCGIYMVQHFGKPL